MTSHHYGDGNTIHDSNTIDVVLNKNGEVVQVWFRCLNLPFHVSYRGSDEHATFINPSTRVVAVDYVD